METTFKINTDSITPEFIEGIKKLFPHKYRTVIASKATCPRTKGFPGMVLKIGDCLPLKLKIMQINYQCIKQIINQIQVKFKIETIAMTIKTTFVLQKIRLNITPIQQ